MVVHTCNPSTPEAKAGGVRVPDQPGQLSQFEISLSHISQDGVGPDDTVRGKNVVCTQGRVDVNKVRSL
jgi:hypothetical protein